MTLKERGANLRKMLSQIPAERLLVETDAPYLTPVPEKKHTRRNEEPDQLAQIILGNTRRLYNLNT